MNAPERGLGAAIGRRQQYGRLAVPTIPDPWLRQFALSILTDGSRANSMIAIAASRPAEGSTTILVNLARILEEELDRRVLVVDTCLAAPALHAVYGVPLVPGLADVLRGEFPLRDAIQIADRGRFAVLAAGSASARDQGLLLTGARLPAVLDQLRREPFDVCLLDCPSVLASPEAAVVARHADTTFCVVCAERTRWGAAEKATSLLLAAGCDLGGVVLNQVPFHIPGFIYRLL